MLACHLQQATIACHLYPSCGASRPCDDYVMEMEIYKMGLGHTVFAQNSKFGL
jgi:hypothetical protein